MKSDQHLEHREPPRQAPKSDPRGTWPATSPRRFLPLAAIAVAAIALLSACGGGDRQNDARPANREVRCVTGRAARTDIPLTVPATGGLEAAKTVTISTRMMGWVRQIHVQEGDMVRKGDLLISIDDADLLAKRNQVEAGIAEAEAVLANAQKMAARFQKLYQDKSVSRQQLDDVLTGRDRAAAGLKSAQARRDEVDVHLHYLEITAPADGLVARKMIEEGNMANPGMPLLVLEQVDRMKVVARVGEKHVSAVKPGVTVQVDVTSLPGASFQVPLDKVIPRANPGSRTYDLEAHVDNPDGRLKSGMFARMTVPIGRRPAILVPAEAVRERGQLRGVFVVDRDQTARLRWVRLGRETAAGVEVLAGLEGDETIVLAAETPLREGDTVLTESAGAVR